MLTAETWYRDRPPVTFRLAHISDIHLGPLPKVKRRELISKRITGYINWHRNRAGRMDDGSLDLLLQDLKGVSPDHIAITGDLVNLALDAEIELSTKWLETVGPPDVVSVVPGNHDTYVPGALAKINKAWKPFMQGDDAVSGNPFPYLRVRRNVAIVGANSGRASLPFMATGSFREKQAMETAHLLKQAEKDGLFRVVLIHHPPFRGATAPHKRLIGASRFLRMIEECGAELILHGHTHISSFEWIDGPNGRVPVIGVPSASHRPSIQDEMRDPNSDTESARYNMFDISGDPGGWRCDFREFGFASDTTREVTELTKTVIY